MRRVVLIQPRRDGRVFGKSPGSPYTLMRLASLVPNEIPVEIWDENVRDLQLDTLKEGDLVGITSMTVTIEGAEQIARRAMKQGAGVVLGGVHSTLMPEHSQTFTHSIMVGEGYFTWQQLIQDFAAEGIKGMKPVYEDETWADLTGLATISDRVIRMVDENNNYWTPYLEITGGSPQVEKLSLAVAVVLIFSYLCGLLFSLKTHRDLFNPDYEEEVSGWSVRRGVISLAVAGILVGIMSEVLVGSIAEAAESIGLSEFFIGAIVVAIVGNAAEHWVAVLVAAKNKMDLAVNIAIGSSTQIALFVAPLLVLLSFVFGDHPMALVFNGFELAAIVLAILIANRVTSEGESNWFEGVQLLAVYVILALAFAFA